MEYWDLYNNKREKLNKIHSRMEKLNEGEYHIVVNIWIKNDQNEIILTQRHQEKDFPLKWECTGGSVIAGEDSITGALREVEEEIGLKLKKENGELICSVKRENDFKDIYLFKETINIEEAKLQDKEVIDIKWVTKEELTKMVENKEIAEPIIYDINILEEMKII